MITAEPDRNFFALFSHEAIRFLRLSSPFHLPLFIGLLWLPAWLLLLPILVVLMPPIAMVLDRHDKDQRFTAGYHVAARRVEGQHA